MSTSDGPATIHLRAASEWTELSVSDSYGRPVDAGFGALETSVEPGVYQLEYRFGPAVENQLVAVLPGQTLEPEPVKVPLAAAAPVQGADAFRERDAAAARAHSLRLTKGGAAAGLVLMARATAGPNARVITESLEDVRAFGAALDWEYDEGGEYVIASAIAEPGGATLRARRDKLPKGLDPVLDQSLFFCAGWQTLVFVPCGAHGPVFADASIHMAPMERGWDASAPGALAVEALTWRLRAQGEPPPAELVQRITAEAETNPMAAILLAHLFRVQRDGQALGTLVERLQQVLPEHPDVRALAWLAPDRRERPPQIDWPPLLAAGYEGVERLDGDEPGVLRDGSVMVQIAGHRFKEGLWTAWHPKGVQVAAVSPVRLSLPGVDAPFRDPATQRVLAYLEREYGAGDDPDAEALLDDSAVSDVAYATRLPSAAVARALTDIEAALPPPGAVEPEPAPPPRRAPSDDEPLIGPELLLARIMRALAVIFAIAIILLVAPLEWDGAGALAAVAIVTRGILLTAVCALVGSDVRRFGSLCRLIVFAMWVEFVVIMLVLVLADTGSDVAAAGVDISATLTLVGWAAVDAAIAVSVGRLWFHAYRRRWGLHVLTPGNHRTLAALSELMHDRKRLLAPGEVAANVDDYLAAAAWRHRRTARSALRAIAVLPLARGHAPFAIIPCKIRHQVVRRTRARSPAGLAVRIGHQLGALGYYADPRADGQQRGPAAILRGGTQPGLSTLDPRSIPLELRFDAVVIGSGPTGALVAYRLAERGRRTLIVERGKYVRPSRRTAGVLQSLPDLLDDGGLDLIRDAGMKVLDLSCVGGRSRATTGAWTSLAPSLVKRWNEGEATAGLDAERFEAAWDRVRAWLPGAAHPQQPLSVGAARLMQAITERGEAEAPPASAVRTTSAPDLSARSQDVLDTLLPWGQRRFGDALQILPECEATRIRLRDGSPEAVECRLSDERKLRIQTDVVVLAAGALGSPRLLRESGIRRNVGRRFSFDLTTTLFADFGTPLGRSDGAQLLAAPDPDDPYFVVETVWHPLWLLAMVMPGLFEQHAHNMERRDCILPVRVHVGINRDPTVAVRFRKRPRTVDLETDELQRLVHRMHNAGQLLFDGGAACLLPTTVAYTELCEPSDLDRLLEIGSADELSVTARPQGGAPISVDPKRGVVGPDLAVHGHRGLYVCDASVFPESVTRAPNLAAMALAEYAAEGMA